MNMDNYFSILCKKSYGKKFYFAVGICILFWILVTWKLTVKNSWNTLPISFTLDRNRFIKLCISTSSNSIPKRSIHDIYALLNEIKSSEIQECQYVGKIFNLILSLDKIEGDLDLPKEFIPQVKSWLGNNDALFHQIYHQEIFKVVSKLTGEETLFNPLRSKRPIGHTDVDPLVYVDNIVNSSKLTCDFCKYRDHTASDTFGRIESRFSATSSNTFKLGKFHGLFFPFEHHPLNLNFSVLTDLFVETSKKWFEAAFKLDPSQKYPSMLFDALPHAGASQIHPHVHGILDDKQYLGVFEQLHQSSKRYKEQYGRFLWEDFVFIHKILGLAVNEENAVAIVPLTARKDHEYWIIAPEMNVNVVKLIYRILTAYKSSLRTFCHSSAAVYPILGTFPSSLQITTGLPLIFRIGSRGDCTSVRSDVSSLELYTVNNINSDLEETISALENSSLIE